MHIHFYGHSITNTSQHFPIKTFADLVIEKYQATSQPHSRGVAMCSEERILYDLKKTKKIDVAIIFHTSEDFYFFLPDSRDYNVMDDDEIKQKISGDNYFLQLEKTKDRAVENCERNILPVDEIRQVLAIQQKFLISRDLLKNRFYGALIQIDQYCTAKKIPVIHCPLSRESIPSWFTFTSGIVDYSLNEHAESHINKNPQNPNPYYAGYHQSDNAITAEGNLVIANKLYEYIDQLLSQSTKMGSR